MRKCPSCGNLTTSFSCTRCTGTPLTRSTGERNQVYEGCDPCASETYDGAVPVPYADEEQREEQRRRANKAIDEITHPPKIGRCPDCGVGCDLEVHATQQDPCYPTKKPFINSMYGRRAHLFTGWLRGFVCWWRAGHHLFGYHWSEGHVWAKTGQENHYDSSETHEYTCQFCERVGHGGK